MRCFWFGVAVVLMSTGCAKERGFSDEYADAESADIGSVEADATPQETDVDVVAADDEKEATASCVDDDGDGYGTDCEAGEDCDDTNELIFESFVAFTDGDGDGHTVGQQQVVCGGDTLPAGYVAESLGEDCDDSEASVWREEPLFVDADGDQYAIEEVTECIGDETPEGRSLVSKGMDCDDSVPEVFQLVTLYVDGRCDALCFSIFGHIAGLSQTTAPRAR